MTVLTTGEGEGESLDVTHEIAGDHGEMNVALQSKTGLIHADLSVGANVSKALTLKAAQGMSHMGVILVGSGFIVQPGDPLLTLEPAAIKPYLNGRDLTQISRGVFVIDLAGLTQEEVRTRFPHCYQRLYDTVRAERAVSRDDYLRDNWWLFRRTNKQLRSGLAGLNRYIGTTETAKHRTFSFIGGAVLPDQKIRVVTSDDALHLGVLSSRAHVDWALATGGRLGVGNDPVYNNTRCFETFPFPTEDTGLTPELRSRIASLAEQLDAHRKHVLSTQNASNTSEFTLTGLYNVLEALKAGRELTAKEKLIHTQGLVGVLQDLHDDLDTAVLQAYGWADAPDTPELLTRLVALNTRRAAEEMAGLVRWLRPAFQNPAIVQAANSLSREELLTQVLPGLQANLALNNPIQDVQPVKPNKATSADIEPQPWPATLPEQVRAVAAVLAGSPVALSLEAVEARFKSRGAWRKSLPRILDTLEALGRAWREGDGWRG